MQDITKLPIRRIWEHRLGIPVYIDAHLLNYSEYRWLNCFIDCQSERSLGKARSTYAKYTSRTEHVGSRLCNASFKLFNFIITTSALDVRVHICRMMSRRRMKHTFQQRTQVSPKQSKSWRKLDANKRERETQKGYGMTAACLNRLLQQQRTIPTTFGFSVQRLDK